MRNTISIYQRLVRRSLDWSLGVKAEAKLAGMVLRIIPLVFGALTVGRIKVAWGFARFAARMYKRAGARGLAVYLKTCYLLTQQIAGGMRAASPWELGCNVSRTRRGVPRIINSSQRKLILSGDVDVIRFWLTCFGLYRVIPFQGKLKLNTITDPGKDLRSILVKWRVWVPMFLALGAKVTKLSWKLELGRDLRVLRLPVILKSAPNSGGHSSLIGLPLDALAFWVDGPMRVILLRWLRATDSLSLHSSIESIFTVLNGIAEVWLRRNPNKRRLSPIAFLLTSPAQQDRNRFVKETWGKPLYFGRLGFKQEPGKIRVFAMVNLITQTLMRPLHEWIFARLRRIPTDGTFNQTAPVERLLKSFKGNEFVASYDLSAATDRLPVVIQIMILEPLLGKWMARAWAYLLVGRPYGLPKVARSWNLGFNSVSYAVGQPMGALSSWAMLALTHHAIVQYAARLAYPTNRDWFMGYALLGDDIVLTDKAVAEKYLILMDTLGVGIGLAKSLLSKSGSLEFAKRTWVRGRSATPFSLAELSVAVASLAALEELWRKAALFGEIRVAAVARFLGFGYKNLGQLPVGLRLNNRLSRLLAYLHRPGGLFPMSFETWVLSDGPGRVRGLDFYQGRAVARSLVGTLAALLKKTLDKIEREINKTFNLEFTKLTFIKKVRSEVGGRVREDRRLGIKRSRVWGPSFFDDILKWPFFGHQWDRFFKEWVLTPYLAPISRRYSELRIRLRGFSPESISGFTGLEQTWRWINDVEEGLKALPQHIDLVSRQDDVKLTPSTIIRLWMKLRRQARKAKGPK